LAGPIGGHRVKGLGEAAAPGRSLARWPASTRQVRYSTGKHPAITKIPRFTGSLNMFHAAQSRSTRVSVLRFLQRVRRPIVASAFIAASCALTPAVS